MSAQNNLSELYGHAFDTLRGLKDGTVNIDQAKARNDTIQTIVNIAKAEIDYARVAKTVSPSFFSGDQPAISGPIVEQTATGTKTIERRPDGVTVTRHRMSQ